jgi:type IV secretion system protein VirB10
MTDTSGGPPDRNAVPPRAQDDPSKAFQLRPERPGVTRISRKVLIGVTALVLALISGAVFLALQSGKKRAPASEELYSTDHHNVADQLAGLPKDYTSILKNVPPLGPPLPGDLGRPMVAAQAQNGPLAVDAEQQRVNQESEAARTSKLFASTNVRPLSATTASNDAPASGTTSSDETFAQNGQDRKLAFVNASVDRRTTSPHRLVKPASPFVVQAGTVIPGALLTGIRSDLPGLITAQVTEGVYDTPTGRTRLIPQGARLIGTYDSQVAFGQSRVLLVWTRLISGLDQVDHAERPIHRAGAAAGSRCRRLLRP